MPDTSTRSGPGDATTVAAGFRIRVLLGAVLGSVLGSYLLAVAVAAAAGLTAGIGPDIAGLLTTAIPLWLAAHQVPLTMAGAPLGVLPLLPTVGLALLVGRFAGSAIGKLGGRWGGDAAWLTASLAGGHGCLAVLSSALPVNPAQVQPWPALLGAGLVAALGAGVGVFRCAGAPVRWSMAPAWVRTGLAGAVTAGVVLVTAATLLLLAALLASLGTVIDWFESRPGLGAWLGVGVLTVCYLPNAVLAAVSWLAGPGVVIGTAAASPLAVAAGPLPPLPLLAAMPTGQPPGWASVVFALPMAAGVLAGRRCRRDRGEPTSRLRSAALAAAVVAVVFWVLATVVSGRLGGGPFDPVELPGLGGALALLGWVGLPALLTAVLPERGDHLSRLSGRLTRRRPAPADRPTEPEGRRGRRADRTPGTDESSGNELPEPGLSEPGLSEPGLSEPGQRARNPSDDPDPPAVGR